MTARTHDAFAFATLITVAGLFPPENLSVATIFTAVVGNVVGALIPDLDQASNRLWDLLPAGNQLGKIFRHLFLSHRTISHSLLGGFLLFKILELVLPRVFNSNYVDPNILLVSIMLGFASHLVADAITKEGIPLFFPFSWKVAFPPLRILRVITDSWVEHLVILPSVAIYIGWFFIKFQDTFTKLFRML